MIDFDEWEEVLSFFKAASLYVAQAKVSKEGGTGDGSGGCG
jgi:hypothetical protein